MAAYYDPPQGTYSHTQQGPPHPQDSQGVEQELWNIFTFYSLAGKFNFLSSLCLYVVSEFIVVPLLRTKTAGAATDPEHLRVSHHNDYLFLHPPLATLLNFYSFHWLWILAGDPICAFWKGCWTYWTEPSIRSGATAVGS